jgi:hypothetical protein
MEQRGALKGRNTISGMKIFPTVSPQGSTFSKITQIAGSCVRIERAALGLKKID